MAKKSGKQKDTKWLKFEQLIAQIYSQATLKHRSSTILRFLDEAAE